MSHLIPPELDFDLPDGTGVDFPPPVLPLEVYCAWLAESYADLVARGGLERILADPARRPVEVPFCLE